MRGREGREGREEREGPAVKLKTGSFSTWSCDAGRDIKLRLLSGATAGARPEPAVRSTLLRPESATFDFILRLDLAWLVGRRGDGLGVSVPVLSVIELVVVGGLTTSLCSLLSVLVVEVEVKVVEGVALFLSEAGAGPGLALASLAWL